MRGYQMRAQEGVFADRFKYLHEADPAQALRAHPLRRPHAAAACHFRRSCRPFCDAVHHPTTTPSPTHHPLVHPVVQCIALMSLGPSSHCRPQAAVTAALPLTGLPRVHVTQLS